MIRLVIILSLLPFQGFCQTKSSTSKSDLTKTYSQAIGDFIKAAGKKHNTSFDTLFFGKHVYGQADDFPDIDLPKTIEKTQIRLISPEDGLKKQKARKSLVYVNLVGWVEKERAEFIFVVFSNACAHQYDCFINYKYDAKQKAFVPEPIKFEYYQLREPQR